MEPRPSTPDFSAYVGDRTRHFAGRDWVFRAIDRWLDQVDGPRFLVITGAPGSGKTAIAAMLSLISTGRHAPPNGVVSLREGFLSAAYFCSARDQHWNNPFTFSESVATQLANRYPVVLRSLTDQPARRTVNIAVTQDIGVVKGGHVAGVVINLSGPAAEDAFLRAVRQPLDALFDEDFNGQVVLLVDAIDEALHYSGSVDIVRLLAEAKGLPAGVRFILTSRRDDRVERRFQPAETISLSAARHAEGNRRDIAAFVDGQLARIASEAGAAGRSRWVKTITDRTAGNFQYAAFLLRSIAEGTRAIEDVEGLPEGLDGLYHDALERVVELGGMPWLADYAPLVGLLSVAAQSLTADELQHFSGCAASTIWTSLGDLSQFIETAESRQKEEQPSYRSPVLHRFPPPSIARARRQALSQRLLPRTG